MCVPGVRGQVRDDEQGVSRKGHKLGLYCRTSGRAAGTNELTGGDKRQTLKTLRTIESVQSCPFRPILIDTMIFDGVDFGILADNFVDVLCKLRAKCHNLLITGSRS